ncbi:MAG TPA: TetR/AcrR family transcriptional regulator [Acidimicrobiales bacterium]
MPEAAADPANPADAAAGAPGPARLRGADRRTALIDAAAAIVTESGVDAVTMDSVAARAGVSRPLVYKHFANRHELLAELYRREAAELDAAIVASVEQAEGFENKMRAMIRAVLEAVTTHGPLFTPLARAGVRDDRFRAEQRRRDRRTVRFFARLAMAEYGIDEPEATAATAVLLTGIESLRAQSRTRPGPQRRQFLEDLYVDLVLGGLERLARRKDLADPAPK